MINLDENKKRIIFLAVIAICILFIILVIVRYNNEGEKEMPFYIEKALIVSTATGKSENGNPSEWNINVNQNNDIYLYISKSKEKEGILKKVTIENFQINKPNEKGEIKIYRPTGELSNLYDKSEQNYLNSKIEYEGSIIDDLKQLEISNQGGILGFRVSNENLGNFISNEEEEVQYDGNLLTKIGITEEMLQFDISFDIIIETEEDVKYKSTINIELPSDELITKGKSERKVTDLNNLVFKRVK